MKIVYLHGFASGPQSSKAQFFRKQFEALGIEMTIPDLSAGDFENLTLGGQLRVVERACGGDEIVLMGSSMGGYLAAIHAARHPEIRALVLLAPAFRFAPRWRSMLGEDKIEEWRRTGSLTVFHYGDRRDRSVGYALLEEAEQYDEYPSVAQPVLIFHGHEDTVVPWRFSGEFAARNPQTVLRVMDSGHELINVLEEMWTETREFLAL